MKTRKNQRTFLRSLGAEFSAGNKHGDPKISAHWIVNGVRRAGGMRKAVSRKSPLKPRRRHFDFPDPSDFSEVRLQGVSHRCAAIYGRRLRPRVWPALSSDRELEGTTPHA